MDALNMAVYASAMLNQLNDCTYSRRRPIERCQPRRASGRNLVARLAAAAGAIAALLVPATR